MKVTAIIPSRMNSSRFPGKPLFSILGIPMIEHVRRRTELSAIINNVIIATCDEEIFEVVTKNGGIAVMTNPNHMRPTERTEEAALSVDSDIILMVQGDEPMVLPETLEKVIRPFIGNPELQVVNLVHPIIDRSEIENKNVVKVVLSLTNNILLLSRSPIPSGFIDPNIQYFKQSGIIAFRKSYLHQYAKLKSTNLEINESVDMLRVLEHGYSIMAVVEEHETKGVDTPEQISIVEDLLKNNAEQKKYFNLINQIERKS